ncbi:MAG TPA: DUF222 domain-containing protein, partial [Acidimicrobiales bacterium]|nr:DUF222 domain-containing protein [Acidimicrobiales bacterium]
MSRYAARFEADVLSVDDARRAASEAAAIEATAATVKALASARTAKVGDARRRGARSAAHELARATGTSVSSARQVIETGQRLGHQSDLRAAAGAGELSATQASLVSEGADADPGAEQRLVEVAKGGSLGELRQAVSEVKAAALADPEGRRRQIRDQRRLRAWTDTDGVWHLRADGNPEDGAQVMAALSPITDELFHAARREGRREPPEAYAFDSLVILATEAASDEAPASKAAGSSAQPKRRRRRRGAPATILCRVDWDAFLAGAAREGETCELAGYGPVAMSVVHDLLETANPFIVAILTKAKEVVGVAHLGRRPNAYQRSALQWLYPSCAAAGCVDQMRLENDHREDWVKTHFTAFDLMDRFCRFHHWLKTNEGWALVEGKGKR